jgi:hypothetical protein
MARDSSPLRDRVIFVEGAPRSGTTWLVTLLATHPEIAGVDAESHLFDFGLDRLFDNLEARDPDYHGLQRYIDRDELVDLARDFCDGVFSGMRAHVSNGTAAPFVVEKTPIDGRPGALDIERKREVYPDAWYIHIVRDREAVARSLMRAPWMSSWRSYEDCAAHWDRAVGRARAALGDLPRYREVSYVGLRGDPAGCCKELFEWLGVEAGEGALETVRVLSREQFSDLGAAPPPPPARNGRLRPLLSRARAWLEHRQAREEDDLAIRKVAFSFMQALHQRDDVTVRSLTAPSIEMVYRSDGDLVLRDEEARAALVALGNDVFGRRYVSEWWASPVGGPGEWWTSAPGKALATVFFSGIGGDATRVDFAISLHVEEELVRRVVIISSGPLHGRAIVQPRAVSQEARLPNRVAPTG